jgi:chromate reductase
MLRIGYLVGSLSADSINRRVAETLAGMAGDGVELVEIPIRDLPLFDRDLEANYPPAVVALKEAIAAVDGLLFVTPEHNRSIPAALKNAIDFATRPWGQSVLPGKPAAIVGATPGSTGTLGVQLHLRSILPGLGVLVLGQPEMYLHIGPESFDEAGNPEPELRKLLEHFLDSFVSFIRRVSPDAG